MTSEQTALPMHTLSAWAEEMKGVTLASFLCLCTWMTVNAWQAASSSTICCFVLRGIRSSASCSVCLNHQPARLPSGTSVRDLFLWAATWACVGTLGHSSAFLSSDEAQNPGRTAEIWELWSDPQTCRKNSSSPSSALSFYVEISWNWMFFFSTLKK